MSKEARDIYRNNFLWWGLLIYGLCVLAFPVPKGGIAAFQVPSFALLLLVLIQVIFPQFRFSRTANLIAVLVIVGLGIASASSLMSVL